MAVVGEASIIVKAITTQVKRDIQKAFADARPVIKKEGELAGNEYAKSFNDSVKRNLNIDLSGVGSRASQQIGDDLDRHLPNEVGNAARAAGKQLEDELANAGSRGGRKAGKGFLSTFGGDFKNAIDRVMNLASAFDLLGPAIANVVGALSSVVSGLFAIATVGVQAAGALAVLPGLLAAIGQAFGAVKLGFGGVGEALKLGAAAEQAATAATGASTAASAANTKALQRQTKARADLVAAEDAAKKSQEDLNRLKKIEADAARKEEEAKKRLAEAIKNVNKIKADPTASKQELARARNEVTNSRINLERTTDAHTKAMQDRYKASLENDKNEKKLAKAQAAAKKANVDVGKAALSLTPAAKAADAYAAALAALTPQARAFVIALLAMKKEFKAVGDAVATKMFPPLTKALGLISDSKFFDILKTELAETGKIAGTVGLRVAQAFTTDANMNMFQRWLHDNNDILDTLTTRVDGAKSPIEALVSLVLKLARGIQPLTKRFAEWAGALVVTADAGSKVGEFRKFFNQAGIAAAKLGSIFGHLFRAIANVAGVARPFGYGLLDSFEKATKQLEKFTDRPKNAAKFSAYFVGVNRNFRAISKLIKNISKEIITLGDNKGISEFADGLEPAVKTLGDIGDKLSSGESGAALADLATAITDVIDSLTQTNQLTVFLDTLTVIVKAIGFLADAFQKVPFAGFILGALGAYRAISFAARILGFGKSLDFLRGKLFSLVKAPFKKIAAGLKGLVPARFRRTPTPPTPPVTDSTDTTEANARGVTVGEALSAGIAEGIEASAVLINNAVTNVMIGVEEKGITVATGAGQSIGGAIAEGVALGIRESTTLAATAADDIGDAVILALKEKLGIASPSVVMTKLGENTGEGFVLGVRAEAAQAYAAGFQLGEEATAGARAGSAGAGVAGATAARTATPSVVPPALAANTTKLGTSAAKTGGILGKLAGGLKALAPAILGVSWPIVAVVAAIVLLVVGLKALYKHSPEFKKFVDGIVGKLKELGAWFVNILEKYVLPVLDKFFGWVNANMPKIQKIVGDVFDDIGKFIQDELVPIWNDDLLPAFEKLGEVVAFVMPYVGKIVKVYFKIVAFYIQNIVIRYFKILFTVIKTWITVAKAVFPVVAKIVQVAFNLIKGYVVHVLIPIFKVIVKVVKALLPVFKSIFNDVKTIVEGVFEGIKFVWDHVLHPVFDGIKTVVKTTFSAVETVFNGFKTAFRKLADVASTIGDDIKAVFDGIKAAARVPVEFIVGTLWNDGLRKFINAIPGVPDVPAVPGFARGGWTGSGSKYKPAGIVHADEFVIQKSSRQMFERLYPGLLDTINRSGRLPSGHSAGGRVQSSIPGYVGGGLVDGIGDILGGGKDLIVGGIKWTAEKATALFDAVQRLIEFLKNLPGMISSGLEGTEFGRLISGFPKAAVNKLVDFLNGAIPNGIPKIGDNPFSSPFPGIGFKARGGRVRAGAPYIVGELQPELFVPDSSGMVIPSLKGLGGVDSVKAVLEELRRPGTTTLSTTNLRTTNDGGQRVLNINVNNPQPERAGQSVSKQLRSKAINSGWGL